MLACISVDPVIRSDGDASKGDRLALGARGRLARLNGACVERLHSNGNLPDVVCISHAAVDDDALQQSLQMSHVTHLGISDVWVDGCIFCVSEMRGFI